MDRGEAALRHGRTLEVEEEDHRMIREKNPVAMVGNLSQPRDRTGSSPASGRGAQVRENLNSPERRKRQRGREEKSQWLG